jgi:hypothetical protein
MGIQMNNNKKAVSQKKSNSKFFIPAKVLHRIIVGAVAAVLVVVVGAFIVTMTDMPAMVMTGATVAGHDVKVNELDYWFYSEYNQFISYGVLSSKDDLAKVYDETTGATYKDFLYDMAAQNLQSTYILCDQAKAAGFKAQTVKSRVDSDIAQIRSYADQKNTTADKILKMQYGNGVTVRVMEEILTRKYTAAEYAEYLKQTAYPMTEAEMKAVYDAAPQDYDKVTYNTFFFASDAASTATDAEKQLALSAAKAKAQGVIDSATDPTSFRDACEKAAGDASASSFADGADPTLAANASKSDVTTNVNADLAEYLFSTDRKAGDKTVIETTNGYFAVYFQSRDLDKTATVSYRVLTISTKSLAEAKTTLEGYQKQVTDENSFINLVKKYSDDTISYTGGLTSGVTADTYKADSATEVEKTLSAWLLSADRKPGDMIIIENIDSVALYYFKESLPAWEASLASGNATTKFNTWYSELTKVAGNGYTLNLGNVEFATY